MQSFYDNIQGWFSDFHKRHFFKTVVETSGPALFVEVGCWKGKSSAFMASQIKNLGKDIKFYCIDTWEGSKEHANDPSIVRGTLFQEFTQNMKPVEGFYTAIRKPSLQAVESFADASIDFLYLDGSHEYQDVLDDLNAWYSKMKSGGVLCGDDYHPTWQSVVNAVNEFFGHKHIPVKVDGPLWIVQIP